MLNKVVYTDKELNSLIGMELEFQMLDYHNDIQRINKLVNGTKITADISLEYEIVTQPDLTRSIRSEYQHMALLYDRILRPRKL